VHVTNCDVLGGGSGAGDVPVPVQRLGPFDKVLVDAPCSSDRHLAQQGSAALAKWATGTVKANAERQLELLRCAARLVRPGGLILYATCALSETENDAVVSKFLQKELTFGVETSEDGEKESDDEPTSLHFKGAERTVSGMQILPDRTPYGPIYFARLRRL